MVSARRLLECVLVISVFVVWKCEAGATCSRFIDITMASVELLVNTSGTPCVRCLATPTTPVAGNTFYFIDGGPTTGRTDVEVTGGVLIILDPEVVIPDGNSPLLLSCQVLGGFEYDDIELRSNNLSPPTISPESLTINEGGDISIFCLSSSPRALNVDEVWLNPQMVAAVEGLGNILNFENISRSQSGVYRCILTSGVTNQTESADFPVTVNFRPDATTGVDPDTEIILEGTLTLTCDFDGVPIPNVTWTQNNTIELSDSDPRITTTTTANAGESRVATLEITGIDRDGGGLYTCSFNNSVGVREVNVSTVLIFIPPTPVTDLVNTTYEEELITITWTNGFDGFTPITGATIEYTPDGGSTTVCNVSSSDPTTKTLSLLMPFTNYTISVSLFNIAGTGDAMVIQVQTRSRQLAAPVNVMITPVNSTVLDVMWDPPPMDAGTDSSDNWFVELFLAGVSVDSTSTPDAQTTMVTFSGLNKGTVYNVTVRGANEVGPGVVSEVASEQTIVDPPSAPEEVTLTGLTSFALRVTWEPPEDDGGRPIASYNVDVAGLTFTPSASADRMLRIVDNMVLMENTSYTVTVTAQNMMDSNGGGLTGPAATDTARTLSLDQPQSLLEVPIPENPMNTSVTLSWEDPGGDVDAYIIRLTQNVPPNLVINVSVNGNLTSTVLRDLEPDTSYTVAVFSMNQNGLSSIPSPLTQFDTLPPLPPVVTSNINGSSNGTGTVLVGTTVVLTCTTTDTRPITWTERSGISLVPTVFAIQGDTSTSTLTINNIQIEHRGDYVCEVRGVTTAFEVNVEMMMPTTSAPDEGISDSVIIIAASVAGGGLLIALICVLFVVFFCCCCRQKDKDSYVTNKAVLKPDKRTKELFEVSTSYAPVRESTDGNETGISFNMPESYQAHSSFNTLDKNDRPPQRSTSPEAGNTSSFGVTAASSSTDNLTGGQAGSPPRYQDMPGTVL